MNTVFFNKLKNKAYRGRMVFIQSLARLSSAVVASSVVAFTMASSVLTSSVATSFVTTSFAGLFLTGSLAATASPARTTNRQIPDSWEQSAEREAGRHPSLSAESETESVPSLTAGEEAERHLSARGGSHAEISPAPPVETTTVTYPSAPDLATSPYFDVEANGRKVWTEKIGAGGLEDLNVARFSCAGRQEITVTASEAITHYVIRPKSRGVRAQVEGRELRFTLDGPQKLYIEVNDLPHLAVFADPLEENPPLEGTPGVVYYGPGHHQVGEITLQSHQTIYIAAGAVVQANIRGKDVQQVKIAGRGSLNGNIRIDRAEDLEVEGIFIRNTKGWSNTLTDCRRSVYRNVKVFSYEGVWGLDGINPISCKDFLIDDCFIRTRDDCISIKSPTRREGDLDTDSIRVERCVLVGWDHADGVTLGFELQGGRVRKVHVRDCDILRAWGQGRTGGHAAFSIVCDGASEVSDIWFENIRVEADIEYKNLEIILTEGSRYGDGRIGSIRDIHLSHIEWEHPHKPFVIAGVPSQWVENVTFRNCYVAGKLLTKLDDADFQTEFVRGIRFVPGGEDSRERYPSTGVSSETPIPGLRRQMPSTTPSITH